MLFIHFRSYEVKKILRIKVNAKGVLQNLAIENVNNGHA